MNFWLLIVSVISTTGICNGNAVWNKELEEKMSSYFSNFFQNMVPITLETIPSMRSPDWNPIKHSEETTTKIGKIKTSYEEEVKNLPDLENPITVYSDGAKLYEENTDPKKVLRNYEDFVKVTKESVDLLLNVVKVYEGNKVPIKEAIKKLCRNINSGTNHLPDDYKGANLPLRETLKTFFTDNLGKEKDFNKICQQKNLQLDAELYTYQSLKTTKKTSRRENARCYQQYLVKNSLLL